jgi:hypothetical protein
MLPTVTSIQPGSSVVANVSGVPQLLQNVRVTGADERSSAGEPRTTRTASRAYVAQVTTGAPAARRHIVQWQCDTTRGSPRIS